MSKQKKPSEIAVAQDKVEAEVLRAKPETMPVPRLRLAAACIGSDGVEKWRDGFDNVVVTQGLNNLFNKMFCNGGTVSSTPLFFLHSQTSASPAFSQNWAGVSASATHPTGCFVANFVQFGFASHTSNYSVTTQTTLGMTGSASCTVYGGGFFHYASNSCATNFTGSTDAKLYNYGCFANSRTLTSNDSLVVSATLSLAT